MLHLKFKITIIKKKKALLLLTSVFCLIKFQMKKKDTQTENTTCALEVITSPQHIGKAVQDQKI